MIKVINAKTVKWLKVGDDFTVFRNKIECGFLVKNQIPFTEIISLTKKEEIGTDVFFTVNLSNNTNFLAKSKVKIYSILYEKINNKTRPLHLQLPVTVPVISSATKFILAMFFVFFVLPVSFSIFSGNSEDKGSFTEQQICIATIASTMGRDPSIIKINSLKGNVTYLSYVRKDDGKKWAYRCKLDGNKVIWASDTGRWRDGQYDSIITFSVNSNKINISEKYDDGSGETKTYNSNQLKG